MLIISKIQKEKVKITSHSSKKRVNVVKYRPHKNESDHYNNCTIITTILQDLSYSKSVQE